MFLTDGELSYIIGVKRNISTSVLSKERMSNMDNTQKVSVNICGTDYIITTDEAPGYMQELAVKVDTRVRNLMNSNDRTSLVMATVMTALMEADEAKKATQAADNLRKQLKSFFDDNNRSRVEAENLRREVERLKRDKEDLERKLAAR